MTRPPFDPFQRSAREAHEASVTMLENAMQVTDLAVQRRSSAFQGSRQSPFQKRVPAASAPASKDQRLLELGAQWAPAVEEERRIYAASVALEAKLNAEGLIPERRICVGHFVRGVNHEIRDPIYARTHEEIAQYTKHFTAKGMVLDEALYKRRLAELEDVWRLCAEAKERHGLTALEEEAEAALERLGEIEDAIVDTAAETIAGLVVKLRVALKWHEEEIDHGKPFADRDFDDQTILSALIDAERLAAERSAG